MTDLDMHEFESMELSRLEREITTPAYLLAGDEPEASAIDDALNLFLAALGGLGSAHLLMHFF